MKRCQCCKEYKDESKFGKNKSKPDGLAQPCKQCKSESDAKWRAERKEVKKSMDAAYREKNREHVLAQKRQYRQDNRETCIAKDKAYYEAHKEERKISDAEYYREHKSEKSTYDKEYRTKNAAKRKQQNHDSYLKNKEHRLAWQKAYKLRKREEIRKACLEFLTQPPESQSVIPMNFMGIYQIRNIINNHLYIGSAVSFKNRKYLHFKDLKLGKHHSPRLQAAYYKYTVNAFVFEPIEAIPDEDQLLIREQHYIDALKPVYNVSRIAGEPGNRGVKSVKTFHLIDPDGEEIEITNPAKFCREKNIDDHCIRAMMRGVSKSSYGYSLSPRSGAY